MKPFATVGCSALSGLLLACAAGPGGLIAPDLQPDAGDGGRDAGTLKGPDGGDAGQDAGDAGPSNAGDAGEINLCLSPPIGSVSLPTDDAQHDDQLEWWYWTGHLFAPDGGAYGFEEVFFRTSALGVVSQPVNVALTDIGAQRFRYGASVALGPPVTVANGFELSVGGQAADGGGNSMWLHGAPEDATFDLALDSIKAPVMQGGSGYVAYPNGDWTYYYSRELLQVTGSLSVNGETLPVTGEAWFDHQWGQLQQEVTAGWEWFAIQLDDGRDLMLNWPLVDGAPGAASGTLSDADCNETVIGPNDVTFSSLGTWVSPHTGCSYPMGWQINYLGLNLTVTTDMEDQELAHTGGLIYWEGSSTVSGDATGKAYVELNGFCP